MAAFAPTDKQIEADQMLSGPQRHSMLVGGSRSGKTFELVKMCAARALKAPESRHAIFRLRFNAVRQSIGMDTLPKVMRLRFEGYTSWKYNKTDYFAIFPVKTTPKRDAAELWLAGLDDKERVERVLGKEFCTIYFNECSQIPYASVVTALTRLAQKVDGLKNRAYYDLNPVGTGHWSYRQFIEHRNPDGLRALLDPDNYKYLYMNPVDNAANLDPQYIASLEAMPEKARRRFLEGKYVAQLDGALWTLEMIEGLRLTADDPLIPPFQRVVVAVDPSGASGEFDLRKDEIGIVVAGIGSDGHVYVLEDLTGLYSPETWARITVEAFMRHKADAVVAEINFGGDMVRAVIQGARMDGKPVGQNVPIRLVSASRGKSVRAEPIAAMYERGMVHHVEQTPGQFALLEEEMTNFSTAGYIGPGSPNRADALVWSATFLFGKALAYGYVEFVKEKQAELDHDLEERMKKSSEALSTAGVVNKLDVVPADGKKPTEACPNCGAVCISKVPSGGKRCSSCGTQWGEAKGKIEGFNRNTVLKQ